MTKTSTLVMFSFVLLATGCVTSTAVKQNYSGASTKGKTVELGGRLNSMTGEIEIALDGVVIARGRATPVVGSNSELAGTYNGKPVKAQCVEVPVATRKLLGHTMTRCSLSIDKDKPVLVELWNDSPI